MEKHEEMWKVKESLEESLGLRMGEVVPADMENITQLF